MENLTQFLATLQSEGHLSDAELNKVIRMQRTTSGEGIPQLLIKLGICSEAAVADAFVKTTSLALITADHYPVQSPLSDTVSERFLKQYHVVGLDIGENEVSLAVLDPGNRFVADALRLATGKQVNFKIGLLSEINAALDLQYGGVDTSMDKLADSAGFDDLSDDDLEHLKDLASEAPVIKMVNLIMQRAIDVGASDIHVEPFENVLKVRLRVDGVLINIDAPPVSSTAAVLSRIKLMAKLNIAERRLPQDGRIKIQMLGKELDLRVSTVPTMYGESVVIRLLDKETTVLDFNTLGFVGRQAKEFIETLKHPHGIILITGPTGSGKSTTLYTALKQLNTAERKIITVEDPVEYQLEGINQIQAKPQIGLTFASALRSIVRQDPDVIMIGEMRDLETAGIAVQSAMTGHLVLSTLHTNDSAGAITRLLQMGVEEYLLGSTVRGVLAQRLVRKLCPHCKQSYSPEDSIVEELKLSRFQQQGEIKLFQPNGCERCGGLGYRGRLAIIEYLAMTEMIRELIMAHEQASTIQKLAIKQGMMTMMEDGLNKACQGLTTLDEVFRVTVDS